MIVDSSTTVAHALSPEGLALYREAFVRYKVQALWNMRLIDAPTSDDAIAVARRLRIEGDMPARFLAEKIEQICRATL